jgi:hypothetical protein
MLALLISLLLGGAISWAVTWYYYHKQNQEEPKWFAEIKKILRKHPEDLDWTIKQVLKLYKNEIYGIDEQDSVPFGVCPECGSHSIKHSSSYDEEYDDIYEDHWCEKCGWCTGDQI